MPPTPWRPLLLLASAVLAAHLVLLGSADFAAAPTTPSFNRPLVTRTVQPAEVAPAARAPTRAAPDRPPRMARPSTPAPSPAPSTAPPTSPPTALAAAPESDSNSPSGVEEYAPSAPDSIADQPALPAQAAEGAPAAPAANAPAPVSVPGSLRIKYTLYGEVRQLPYNAGAELLWAHDGTQYEARLEVSALFLGSRVQTSRGQLTPQGLAPKRFSDKVRSEVAAHFEYDKGRVIFSANTPEAALEPGAQDQLSIFIQLAGRIAAEPARYPAGTTLAMQAVGARESDTWRFTVEGPERLDLPGGAQDTLKLSRPPNRPYDLLVEIWLAPALNYLPARIKLTQNNGDFVDQQWRSSAPP